MNKFGSLQSPHTTRQISWESAQQYWRKRSLSFQVNTIYRLDVALSGHVTWTIQIKFPAPTHPCFDAAHEI